MVKSKNATSLGIVEVNPCRLITLLPAALRKGGYTDKEAERNILSNPFKRFEDMQMLRHTKTLGIVQVDEAVWKRLTEAEKEEIQAICDEKLSSYYARLIITKCTDEDNSRSS